MRRTSISLLLAAFVLGTAAPASAGRYTLDQLIHRAADTANFAASREAVLAARAQLRQAHYLWLPQGDVYLSLSGGPDVHCEALTSCLSTDVVDLRDNPNHPSLYQRAPVHNTLLSFNISIIQPLYTFGKIEAADALGEAGVAFAKGNQQRDLADLAVTIVRAYWSRKASRDEVAILAGAAEQMQGWQAEIEAQLDGKNDAGYTEADVARIKLNLVNLRAWLADQRHWALATREAVRVLVGDRDGDVDDGELELLANAPIETLAQWQGRAWDRPDLAIARAGLAASFGYMQLRMAEMLPDIGIYSGLGYGYNTINPANKPFNGYIPQPPGALGGGFTLAVHQRFDLGVGIGRLSQVRHEDASNRARAEQALGGIAIEVAKGWTDYQEAVDRAHATAEAEKAARGWVIAVDADLRAGIYRDVREMWESFRNWTDFRIRHVQAVADANIAYAVMRRASDIDVKSLDRLAASVTGQP